MPPISTCTHYSLSLSHVSNGIKGIPTLMLEDHGMCFQVIPCLSDPWHFIPMKACNKPNDIIYLCSTASTFELDQNQQTSQKLSNQTLSQATMLSPAKRNYNYYEFYMKYIKYERKSRRFCLLTFPFDNICCLFSVIKGPH